MEPFNYGPKPIDDGVLREHRERVEFNSGAFYDGEWNLDG